MGILSPKPGGTFVGNLLRGLGINKTPAPPPAPGEAPTTHVPIPTFGAEMRNITPAGQAGTTAFNNILGNPLLLIGIAVLIYLGTRKRGRG